MPYFIVNKRVQQMVTMRFIIPQQVVVICLQKQINIILGGIRMAMVQFGKRKKIITRLMDVFIAVMTVILNKQLR